MRLLQNQHLPSRQRTSMLYLKEIEHSKWIPDYRVVIAGLALCIVACS